MSGKRPGQVRFEAWVPEPLYRQFQAAGTPRAPWLRAAIAAHLANLNPTPEPHRHTRTPTGTHRYSLGQRIDEYACSECGEPLT